MDNEDSSVNFSTEDPANVSIPESLGPIAYELFELLVFRIKKFDNPNIVVECLKFMRRTQEFKSKFLIHERRFETKVLPLIYEHFDSAEKTFLNTIEVGIFGLTIDIIRGLDLNEYGDATLLKSAVQLLLDMIPNVLKDNDINDKRVKELIEKRKDLA